MKPPEGIEAKSKCATGWVTTLALFRCARRAHVFRVALRAATTAILVEAEADRVRLERHLPFRN